MLGVYIILLFLSSIFPIYVAIRLGNYQKFDTSAFPCNVLPTQSPKKQIPRQEQQIPRYLDVGKRDRDARSSVDTSQNAESDIKLEAKTPLDLSSQVRLSMLAIKNCPKRASLVRTGYFCALVDSSQLVLPYQIVVGREHSLGIYGCWLHYSTEQVTLSVNFFGPKMS